MPILLEKTKGMMIKTFCCVVDWESWWGKGGKRNED